MERQTELLERVKRWFKCDTARIATYSGKRFLIIGWNRNTANDSGCGYTTSNGKRVDYNYIEEKCIASGRTYAELTASAKEDKRLRGLSWEKYFEEILNRRNNDGEARKRRNHLR